MRYTFNSSLSFLVLSSVLSCGVEPEQRIGTTADNLGAEGWFLTDEIVNELAPATLWDWFYVGFIDVTRWYENENGDSCAASWIEDYGYYPANDNQFLWRANDVSFNSCPFGPTEGRQIYHDPLCMGDAIPRHSFDDIADSGPAACHFESFEPEQNSGLF